MTCSNKKIQRNDRDEKMHWTTSSACPKKVPKIVDLAAILFMLNRWSRPQNSAW